MTNLIERLTDLADSLDACEWNHPLGSAKVCREAAKEIQRLTAERSDKAKTELREPRTGQWQERGP